MLDARPSAWSENSRGNALQRLNDYILATINVPPKDGRQWQPIQWQYHRRSDLGTMRTRSREKTCQVPQPLRNAAVVTLYRSAEYGRLYERHNEVLAQIAPKLSRIASLDCAVRTMLMTECVSEGTAAIGSGNDHWWAGTETLVDYLVQTYPQSTSTDVPKDLIDLKTLRCHVLARDAGIKIQQTEKLSDHLYLRHSPGTKVLLVFSHRAFLEHSRKRLEATHQDLSHSVDEALALLLTRFDYSKKDLPGSLHDLYEDSPHWASQLSRLLKEVNDPTPTTRWERYAERRKSHRHTYKCAIAALIVAAVSRTLATLLAAVQVWISYCDWDKNAHKALF
ncbi:hypothetical protein CSAL01_03174 [Colletotrichum salicis]|uniref:Uncharacterized protein n=1 Tax=Colletotrichum salicis TaxID=1209931 RepID=A0A135ST90_9PEZI|nr:hypothetical protein CSAL01_03174 [Colletotrichum salicis]